MAKDKYYGKTLRKNFARHEEVMAMPNLLEIQKKSYKWFLDTGLREVFADVASIGDYAGNLELSFIDYSMDEKPKYDVEECKARDATYAAPLKVRVRLRNKETEEIKEQEIFMGDFPLMTHLRHQRRRARGGQPDRPLPRHLLRQGDRPENGPAPADVHRDPLPGRVAGV